MSHDTISTIIGVVYLGLITNALLVLGCLPLVLVLVTTDPMHSWPVIAATLPLSAPAVTAAFSAFREQARGGNTPARAFLAGLRATWRRAFLWSAAFTALIVVLLVDVRALAETAAAVVVVPVLAVLVVLAAAMGLLGLVAISEAPRARFRDVLRASLFLSVKRWYLSAVSLLALCGQFAVFTSYPALALGLTAAPALYILWGNARFTLRPVLEDEIVAAS